MIETKVQIRFSDIDPLGHVNNTRIQEYFDLGKTDYFFTVLRMEPMVGKQGVIMANSNSNYFAPVFISENIWVRTRVAKVGNKSISMEQTVVDKDNGQVKASCASVLVAYDFERNDPVEVPLEWKEKIAAHEG